MANISATQAQAEGVEPTTEPPDILVADLQTLCGHLSEANKTDDVVFAPSSSALRIFARPPASSGDEDVGLAAHVEADTRARSGVAVDNAYVDEFGDEEDEMDD